MRAQLLFIVVVDGVLQKNYKREDHLMSTIARVVLHYVATPLPDLSVPVGFQIFLRLKTDSPCSG